MAQLFCVSMDDRFFLDASDVNLCCNVDETVVEFKKKDARVAARKFDGQEVLCVRAYGSAFFILGINIRTGHYRLQSSRTAISSTALSDSEDALNQGTISVPEVFANLRARIILHLLASIGTVLGLKVYENGLSAVEVPENIVNGSNFLLMGFPDFGHSHCLLMQLDKDFKFVFQLLETQPDNSEKLKTLDIVCCKKVDINQMLMLEDETDLNVLDVRKVAAHLPKCRSPNDASRWLSVLTPKELMLTDTSLTTVTSISSLIDEVFEIRIGTLPVNLRSSNPVISSTDRDGSFLYSPGNNRGLSQFMSPSSLSVTRGRSDAHKLSVSKCGQTIASLRSPQSVEVSFRSPQPVEVSSFSLMDEDQHRFMNESSLDLPTRSSHILSGATANASPLCPATLPEHDKNSRKRKNSDILNLLASSQGLLVDGDVSKRRGLLASKQLAYSDVSSEDPVVDEEVSKRRRLVAGKPLAYSDISSEDPVVDGEVSKRRRLLLSKPLAYSDISSDSTLNSERIGVGNLIARANRGNATSGVYMPVLLHVVRHCSLRIKRAMLTSQLEAMDIPYFEEMAPRASFLHIRFKVPFVQGDSWQDICLRLGNPGKLCWDVKITDKYFKDLWKLSKGDSDTPWGSGIHIVNTSNTDSYIRYNSEGIIISYQSVEADSIKKLVGDIHRLHYARMFALGMRKILGAKTKSKIEYADSECKPFLGSEGIVDGPCILSDKRGAIRIEAVGLMSFLFSFGSGVLARFIVEWESGRDGCTVHVTPDQLSRNTKFLEDFINRGEVESLLDCICLTAGPLHALAAATGPARVGGATTVPGVVSTISAPSRQGTQVSSQGGLSSSISPNMCHSSISTVLNYVTSTVAASDAIASHRASVSVPSSLPNDISVVLRGPCWIRIIYRKHFAVDMRCYARDKVWLQPARPQKGIPSIGGSLPCTQFRAFIMKHVAQELNGLDRNLLCGQQTVAVPSLSSSFRPCRPGSQVSGLNRAGNTLSPPPTMTADTGLTLRRPALGGAEARVRGELNTTGLDNDDEYGGGWVPLVTLERVLQGVLKYLGVLWLFAQLPDILKVVIGSILKENEGAVLNLDHEQPALYFFIRGYLFSVSVRSFQLLLQLEQQQQNEVTFPEKLTPTEISEICNYFRLRVASDPYDASRVASFITLLTLPTTILREFLKLISGEKVVSQALGGVVVPIQNPRVELCLEFQTGLDMDGTSGKFSGSKSNIRYDRPYNRVDFSLIVVLDPAHIPHINTAGGASWLPYCVSVRLRYSFGENQNVSFLDMEGSHGGRACWLKVSDWETLKRRVARSVEVPRCLLADISQGRLRFIADNVQRVLHLHLQALSETCSGLPGTF